ncbi:hypothetical protein BYT27DRAFT_6394589 [Phlegmacium glaucopus]|nr:hypothetical protein BYT27DRAFT_6394589 [Phlegmacium glaucopus]
MESLYNGLHRAGQTLETAAALRLPKRPQDHSNLNPKTFEDFGSSLAPRSSQGAPSRSKFKPASVISPKTTRLISIKKPLSDLFESEDELDFLSSSQADPDDIQPSKKVPVCKVGKYVDEKGKEHDYDPKFLPGKSNVLSKMKFNKTKKLGGEDNAARPSSSSSSLKNQPDFKENGQDFGSWVNDLKKQTADRQANGDTSTGNTKTRGCSVDDDVLEISSPLRFKSSNRRLNTSQPLPLHRSPPKASIPPRPRPKPLPRKPNADASGSKPPAHAGSGLSTWSTLGFKSSAIIVDGLELIPVDRKTTKTATKKNPSRSPSPETVSTPPKKDRSGSPPPSSPQNFPMEMISPLGEKVRQKPLPESGSKIYVNSSPSLEASCRLSAFPMPSPQLSNTTGTRITSRPNGKNKAQPFPLDDPDDYVGDEESDFDAGGGGKGRLNAKRRRKPQPKPRAFPMPTHMLASIEPVPKRRHQKRISEDRSDDERQAKKKRRSSLLPSRYSFEDEGDSVTISPDTDPHTLCPYCDTPLPSSPSPLLINILAATRKKSTRDPRPSNPLGLKAPLANFIVVCQRHKFESQILPEAERKGWPKTILWQKLAARVERMRDELQALIEDPGGERGLDDVDEDIDEVERLFRDDDDDGTRRKARSIFWTEVMDEVKKKGSRAVVGVRGQFANFEKTQPGYYGEQGSVIIHQTLFDMFPPVSFDPARISPLTSNEFVLRILVPEVALRLIMEDRNLEGNDGMHQALIVLRESSAYGVAMFPEDGGELVTGKKRGDDGLGVGDKIVMERARKRRKELEEEEEQEEREEARRIAEMEAAMEMEKVKEKEKMGGRKGKGKQKEDQQFKEQHVLVEAPRPRPRPVMKASSSMGILPPSDHEEMPQPTQPSARHKSPRNKSTSRTRSRTRSVYSGTDTDPSGDFSSRTVIDLSASESEDSRRPTSEKRRRSPSATESRAEQTKNKAKPSTTRAAVLNISDSDASVGSRTSTKSAARRSSRKNSNAIRKSGSIMHEDLDDGDENDVGLEIENIKTPVRKYSRSSNHRRVKDTSDDEQTPKPLIPPQTSGSNDIKPLVLARMRRSQNDSG